VSEETDKSLHREAPLVHLISIDPRTLSGDELTEHLRLLREMRASPQTARAKTERKVRVKTVQHADLKTML
jgi:hypothetical protein